MHLMTVVGARPQFIKSAPVIRELKKRKWVSSLVHTGQHYDYNMSEIFFQELAIPEPTLNLDVGSGLHGVQTARMLERIEESLITIRPDGLLVYGDTNSTLAGALAAVKIGIPVFHIESGLRSFNRSMPEEHNRVLTDHCSTLLFCPDEIARDQLSKEGVEEGVYVVGDVMLDAYRLGENCAENINIEREFGLGGEYILTTIHRNTNTDVEERITAIVRALGMLNKKIVFPMHPRTKARLNQFGIKMPDNVQIIEPVSYAKMIALQKNAKFIITDSGGVQKEAYWAKVPCITLREETEWVSTVSSGWNILIGKAFEKIPQTIETFNIPRDYENLFGDGQSASLILDIIEKYYHDNQ